MLSLPDATLVQRDAAIPGLGVLLDDDAFVRVLQAALPERPIAFARSTYVRYKPRMNCLVAYQLTLDGTVVDVYAKAHRGDADDKLRKTRERTSVQGALGPGCVVLDEHQITIWALPNDGKLRGLTPLFDPHKQPKLLCKLLPGRVIGQQPRLHTLRYKPERRYVAQLAHGTKPQAVVRVYASNAYPFAVQNAGAFRSQGMLRVARRLGRSRRHGIIVMEWIEGRCLTDVLGAPDGVAAVMATGTALALLHRQAPSGLTQRTHADEIAHLRAVADGVGVICPDLAPPTRALAAQLAAYGNQLPTVMAATHGDFYADQVLLTDNGVALLDLDRAAWGDPAVDLGVFIAHLLYDGLRNATGNEHVARLREAFLAGYAADGRMLARIEIYTAIGLLLLAPDPFRRRIPNWPTQMAALIEQAQAIADRQIRAADAAYTHAAHR